MSNTDLTKIKGQTPLSIIVHGGDYTGYLLSKTLLEQGSQVVIIDRYTSQSKQYFSELRKSGKVSFIDFKGIKNFYEKIARIDYLFYLLGEKLEKDTNIDSKDFLQESGYLGLSLESAQKFKAKISIVTSLRLNRELSNRINNEKTGKSTPYSPLELQRYAENSTAEFVDKSKGNIRILRLGTVIGKGITKVTDRTLDRLFTDATQKPQIEIQGEGLEIHNLIHETDATYGILKLTFDDNTKGEVISLCNKNDYTTLSLSYKLLELDVESKAIKFTESEDDKYVLQDLYVPAPNASQFSWKQNVSLEEAIVEQIKSYYERSDKKWDLGNSVTSKRKGSEDISNVSKTKLGLFVQKILSPFKSIFNTEKLFSEISYWKITKYLSILILSILGIYYLLSPILGISLGTYLIYSETDKLKQSFASFDFDSVSKDSINIYTNLKRVENNVSRLSWLFTLTNNRNLYNDTTQILQGSGYALDSMQDLAVGLRPLGEYIKDFKPAVGFGNGEVATTVEYREYLLAIDDNRYSIQEGIYKMSLAQNLISTVNTKNFPIALQEPILDYKEFINDIHNTVIPLEKVSQFLPDLLGVNERKRYVVLLQNDGEIRSTGGWISSYAILSIEGGQIRELYVDDIYNAEGTLKVKGNTYRTPISMVKALGNTPYSFSLVNWDPNLDTVMTNTEQFVYDLGKGNKIDGVITIDTVFLQKLLDKWGGIEVPGESEIITSSNLYSKIFEMHEEFTPGSSRKSTFLASLADRAVTKILSSDFNGYKEISDVISQSLEEKHLQATFKNTLAKSYFDESNWDGNMDSKYLSAPIDIDWNWGGNKSNLYIKKNHTLEINVKDENTIEYKYQIAIENNSTSNTYPEGEYINYIRIFMPVDVTPLSILGVKDNKYDVYNEGGYKIIGGWFNIPAGENKTLEISYRLTNTENESFPLQKDDTHYSMDINIYKQPGSRKDAYNLNVTYPETWEIEQNEGMTKIGNQLNRRFELATDENFNISWQR